MRLWTRQTHRNALSLLGDSAAVAPVLLFQLAILTPLFTTLMDVLPGDGPTLGPALMDEADFVHFTGSTATGRIIAKAIAEYAKVSTEQKLVRWIG